MRAPHFVAAALLLVLLAVACYSGPSRCETACGVVADLDGAACERLLTQDEAMLAELEARELLTRDESCARLSGWTVTVYDPSSARIRDDFGASPVDGGFALEGHPGWTVYGIAVCPWREILIRDDEMTDGVLSHEYTHALSSCGWPHEVLIEQGWEEASQVAAARARAVLSLTGANGSTP